MSLTDKCSLCGMSDSWSHSLLHCSMSRCVWALSDDAIIEALSDTNIPEAKVWLFHILEVLPNGSIIRFAVTLWAIWTAHRKAIHESIFQTPFSTNEFINRFISKLQVLKTNKVVRNSGLSHMVPPATAATNRHCIPPKGVPAIMTHGFVSLDRSVGVAATICRDDSGKYLGSSALVLAGMTILPVLDAIACREAQALAEDLGARRVVITSENMKTLKDISEKK